MFRHFLVGMVARIFDPGVKVDTMLFLVSKKQGTYKSSFFRYLIDGHMHGNQWFSDSYFDLKSKDGKLLIGTSILVEWSEGEHAKSAKAIDSVKAFLSQQDDDFRLPYGERIVKRPRRCVFCGTSNDEELLHDASGSRRFYIIKTGTIDMQRLEAWRSLLFAEAYAIYRQHLAAARFSPDWQATRWWFMGDEDEARAHAVAEFRSRSVWFDDIEIWVRKRGDRPFTIGEVIEEGLTMARDKKTKATEREATSVLLQLGCQRLGPTRVDGRSGRFWTRAPADPEPNLDAVLTSDTQPPK
jgi:predicted P-loop ATPase